MTEQQGLLAGLMGDVAISVTRDVYFLKLQFKIDCIILSMMRKLFIVFFFLNQPNICVVCKGLFFLGTEASDLQDCSTAVNDSKLPGFSVAQHLTLK